MSFKRAKFLWLDFPLPPEKWEPRGGAMGAAGYDRLSPRDKRIADNFSVCDQRATFIEDAYVNVARSLIFLTRIFAVLTLILILTFGGALLKTLREMNGVSDTNQTAHR